MDDEKKPKALCWQLSRDREYSHFHLNLHVFLSFVEPTQQIIDEAVSLTRWTRPDAAARMASWYRSVLDLGYAEVYERPWSTDETSFRLSWLEYDPSSELESKAKGYTRHEIRQLGNDTFEAATRGLKLLAHVRALVGKLRPNLFGDLLDDPRFVVAALERAKEAVPVVRLDRRSEEPMTIVRSRERRMRLRTEGVLAMFGM